MSVLALMPAPPPDPNDRNSTDIAARFARLTAFAIPAATAGQARLATYQLLLVGLRPVVEEAEGDPVNKSEAAGKAEEAAEKTVDAAKDAAAEVKTMGFSAVPLAIRLPMISKKGSSIPVAPIRILRA